MTATAFFRIQTIYTNGEWLVPGKYVKSIADSVTFDKAISRRRHQPEHRNTRTCRFQMVGQKHESGHNRAAPSSIRTGNAIRHICRSGKEGKDDLPRRRQQRDRRIRSLCQPVHQRRLCIHGVPVNAPRKSLIEYSPTLGTTPRSHMCVRNATSHAKFVYDWAPVNETIVFVFD
ncbi:MAG: L,D-transpeptidase [Parabacteroides merdae]